MPSLLERSAAISLFDFEAAFPSILQEFLLEALEENGLPPALCKVVRCLHWRNVCRIKLKGQLFEGFEMASS
eukprot:9469541-Pyramimonas_sp.AAC.1